MRGSDEPRVCTLTTIARTGDRWRDFRPYVASIDREGAVAFQARTTEGGTGVFVREGGETRSVTTNGPVREVVSHPALARDGSVSFYTRTEDGGGAVVLARGGASRTIAGSGQDLRAIGPLGPTMNDAGVVAFRGDDASGAAGIYLWREDGVELVARADGAIAGFEGLPVVTSSGMVVVRLDRADGGHAICVWRAGQPSVVAETGPRFRALGRFPMANEGGCVAFVAERREGGSGVFLSRDGQIETVVDGGEEFESVRGALVDDVGRCVFIATPVGGRMGLYAATPGDPTRLLSVGDSIELGMITELALNPVSINAAGQLALRLALADGAQLVARLDLDERIWLTEAGPRPTT